MRVTTAPPLRGIGIIRVSEVAGRDRDGDKFVSPDDQQADIDKLCVIHNIKLIGLPFRELDVSAFSTKLEKRKGLYPAIQAIENGEADVIVTAYFDRFFRRLRVQAEAMERLALAGGRMLTGDAGWLDMGEGSAAEWATPQFLGLMAEFQARQTRDKTRGPKERAVARGIPPFPNIPPGYRQDPATRRLVKHADEAKVIQALYNMRQEGASLIECRDYLRAHGIDRSWRATQEILKNRIYLGELHFGKLINLHSHEPIIEPATFRTIQKMRVRRGHRPVSTSLFARQGLVRCAHCGGRMMISQQTKAHRNGERVTYRDYRCPPKGLGNCSQRQSISATVLEEYVVSLVKNAQAEGRWSPNEQVAAVEVEVVEIEAELTALATTFSSVSDVPAIAAKIDALKEKRDAARERRDALLRGDRAARVGTLATLWDVATLDEKRAILRLLIETITVSPGKGTERIFVRFYES
jgi:DNA invertase Pin-like site-specific DNA recombinase